MNKVAESVARQAAIEVMGVVAGLVRSKGALGQPSGELYARLMPYMDLSGYEKMIALMKSTGVIKEVGNVLYFVDKPEEVKP